MALLLRHCSFLVALNACLLVTVRTECNKDCASCTYQLGHHAEINPVACTLECEGKLPSSKAWDSCKELLQLAKLDLSQEREKDHENDENLILAKKYGGFMKRYGGFMKKMDERYHIEPEEENNDGEILPKSYGGFLKKMDELYHMEPEEENNDGEILPKRYGGFMKKGSDRDVSDLLKELLGTDGGDNSETGHYRDSYHRLGEVSKRYGGFMRGFKRSPELEDEAKELQKRYGGFMRRVGRPEWWLDYQKRYGGFMKRFPDSFLPSDEDAESYSKEIPEMEKRYGGFMRF
ncbi:proenkephalin-A [Microcaecilia unicolor]|uniref:Proenkephalin-A n=1 Tax=Microcaecilia unicolor TaxID=1415580 RepID=A0A6P7X745_9AMPH|nr:proenkephalin-A [Microcaecilia unicolor]